MNIEIHFLVLHKHFMKQLQFFQFVHSFQCMQSLCGQCCELSQNTKNIDSVSCFKGDWDSEV